MAIADLEKFDDDFTPATGRKIERDMLEDREYELEVRSAVIDETKNTRESIFKMNLTILDGPQMGNYIEHAYLFRSQENVELLGADLRSIGFDSHLWKKSTGRPLSIELPRAARRMPGMRIKVKKASRKEQKDGRATGRTFHNLFLNGVVDGYGPRTDEQVEEFEKKTADPF